MSEITAFSRPTSLTPSLASATTTAASYVERLRFSMQQYAILSTSIATMTLGLALIVSYLALTFAETPRPTFAQATTDVSMIEAEAAPLVFESVQPEDVGVEPTLMENDDQAIHALRLEDPAPPVDLSVPPPPTEQLSPREQAIQLLVSQVKPPAAPAVQTASSVAMNQRPPVLSRDRLTLRGRIQNVNITFYDCASQGFCGAMYNGRKVFEGAAACSWNLPIGTKFAIVGDPTKRVYVCEDRGLLANTWVDIFWHHPAEGYKWQSAVGRYGTIEILQ